MSTVYIPIKFNASQSIDKVILILDVDGVIRHNVDALADDRVIAEVKKLLRNPRIDVTFISGSSIVFDELPEHWRQSNISLNKVFHSVFDKELKDHRVNIFGVLGGHRMKSDGSLDIIEEYSYEVSCLITKLLIQAFLIEVLRDGNVDQKIKAKELQNIVDGLDLEKFTLRNRSVSPEINAVISEIHKHFDPGFRVIDRGTFIETHSMNPPWNSTFSAKWLHEQLDTPDFLDNKHIATGIAMKGDKGFNFLLVSKTNKGYAIKKHIEEKLKHDPEALVITIGDTQVDFPMHQYADVAFHVGKEEVWKEYYLENVMMIRDEKGRDRQHVEGTLKVLGLIQDALDKPFNEFKYIPKQDSKGKWRMYSLNDP
jgi:hypothetical protein